MEDFEKAMEDFEKAMDYAVMREIATASEAPAAVGPAGDSYLGQPCFYLGQPCFSDFGTKATTARLPIEISFPDDR
jgi:hypothetical protein